MGHVNKKHNKTGVHCLPTPPPQWDKEEQKQRRSLCARIAAAVEASGVPAPSARRRRCRPSERYGKIVLTPAPLFWAKAEALVAQEEF